MSIASVGADLIAGITVALVLIPQSIAYAQLAGLPAQYGLYAAFIPPAIAALWGSSGRLATGPTAIISLMTSSALREMGLVSVEDLVSSAIVLALLVGLIQLFMGIAHLGVVVNFISHPVLIGFSNAAAIIIATSQLPKVFGVSVGGADHYFIEIYNIAIEILLHTNWFSLAIAVVVFVLILMIRRLNKKLPGMLFALVLATGVSWLIGFDEIGKVVGAVPTGLPTFVFPAFSSSGWPTMLNAAFVIALLGFMESAAITKSLTAKTGEKLNPNQELIGQGLANIVGSFGQSYPVAGSFSRSMVNYEAGARTGLASIFTSLFVLAALLFFTPLLFYVPQPALAAMIIASVLGLINFNKIKEAWNIHRSDGIVAVITFLSTLFFAPELDRGILIGVILSTAYYIYTRARPRIVLLTQDKMGDFIEATKSSMCRHILIVRFDGSLFFADADYLESKIMRLVIEHPLRIKYVVLVANGINYVDFSGIEMLNDLVDQLLELDTQLVVVGLNQHIMQQLSETDFVIKLGKERFFQSRRHALSTIYKESHKNSRERNCPLKVGV